MLYQEEYQPPEIPVEQPSFSERAQFGLDAKEKHFLLDVCDGLHITAIHCVSYNYISIIIVIIIIISYTVW